MATLTTEGTRLRLSMNRWERAFSLHHDIEVPWEAAESVEHVANLWRYLRGTRFPGTGFPGVITLGTTRSHGERDFCAVYGHRPGVVVTLQGQEFARLLVSGPAIIAPWEQASRPQRA